MSSSGTTFSTDPALWIFTSLTAGSSHIVTATSRLETILRANRVPFKAIDIATDEKARMLWGRRAGKDANGRMRKLPGLVQEGMVLGDLVEIEEWNEYGELKQNVKIYYDDFTIPTKAEADKLPAPLKKNTPVKAPAPAPAPPAPPLPTQKPKEDNVKAQAAAGSDSASTPNPSKTAYPIRSIADEAAQKAKSMKLQSLREKVYGKDGAKAKDKEAAAGERDDTTEKAEDKPAKEDKKTEDGASGDKPKSKAAESESESEEESSDESSTDSERKPTVLQSPTTATWKAPSSAENLREVVQSPTSTSWRPTHVDPPVTSLHGSLVESASEEEIAAIEKAEAITEKPEEEEAAERVEKVEEERRKSLTK